MGYNPQEVLENTINTMGTLLGEHPIVPWFWGYVYPYKMGPRKKPVSRVK